MIVETGAHTNKTTSKNLPKKVLNSLLSVF